MAKYKKEYISDANNRNGIEIQTEIDKKTNLFFYTPTDQNWLEFERGMSEDRRLFECFSDKNYDDLLKNIQKAYHVYVNSDAECEKVIMFKFFRNRRAYKGEHRNTQDFAFGPSLAAGLEWEVIFKVKIAGNIYYSKKEYETDFEKIKDTRMLGRHRGQLHSANSQHNWKGMTETPFDSEIEEFFKQFDEALKGLIKKSEDMLLGDPDKVVSGIKSMASNFRFLESRPSNI